MIDERMSGPQNREIPLVGKGMENFAQVDLSIGWWESDKEWFLPLEPFSMLKMAICKSLKCQQKSKLPCNVYMSLDFFLWGNKQIVGHWKGTPPIPQ